jgi:hypothetical protein
MATFKRLAWLVAGAAPAAALLNLLYPCLWYAPGWEGRIVDQDARPISGVLVTANWTLLAPVSGAPLEQVAVAEVHSDADGRYRIPGWGPLWRWHGGISADDPTVRFMHPGYLPQVQPNRERPSGAIAPPLLRSRLAGQSIALTPLALQPNAYPAALAGLRDSTAVLCPPGGDCAWPRAPALYRQLSCAIRTLHANGTGQAIAPPPQLTSLPQPNCGN